MPSADQELSVICDADFGANVAYPTEFPGGGGGVFTRGFMAFLEGANIKRESRCAAVIGLEQPFDHGDEVARPLERAVDFVSFAQFAYRSTGGEHQTFHGRQKKMSHFQGFFAVAH